MDITITEVHDEIVFPLYDIEIYFIDNERSILEYFQTESFIERLGYTTGELLRMEVRVDIFNIDALYEYFNNDTATDIKNQVIIEYNKVYGWLITYNTNHTIAQSYTCFKENIYIYPIPLITRISYKMEVSYKGKVIPSDNIYSKDGVRKKTWELYEYFYDKRE